MPAVRGGFFMNKYTRTVQAEQFFPDKKPLPMGVFDFNNEFRKSTARWRLGDMFAWREINEGDWIIDGKTKVDNKTFMREYNKN